MRKTWFRLAMVSVLLCLAVLSVGASGEGESEGPDDPIEYNDLKGWDIYQGRERSAAFGQTWFDYDVHVPKHPALPIEARELDIKPEYTFFVDREIDRMDGESISIRPIMNLDVFGKLALGYESGEGGAKFDDRVWVDLPPAFLKERTGFTEIDEVYFVFDDVAYTAKEFYGAGKITALDTTNGLSFHIVEWPVDDLMLIGGGH